MARVPAPGIQFQTDDREAVRLQKLRRLAEAVDALARIAQTTEAAAPVESSLTMTGPAVLGRLTGTGAPLSLTGTQINTLLPVFNATTQGVVPSPGSATGTRFLADTGAWSAVTVPAGSILHADLAGLGADGHPQYVLRSILTADGDLFVQAAGVVARLGIGTTAQVLRVSGGAPAWQTVSPVLTLGTDLSGNTTFTDLGNATLNATIVNDAVDNAKLANMAQSRVKGRAEGAGTGDPQDLTPSELVSIFDQESITWTGPHTHSAASPITFEGGAVPSTPAAGFCTLYATTSQGHTLLNILGEDGNPLRVCRDNVFIVRNTSGAPMAKGQVVAVTGSTGMTPTVGLADADTFATRAEAILGEDIADNGFGLAIVAGLLSGIDTSTLVEGGKIYLSQTAGAYTQTIPTAGQVFQELGTVLRSHLTQGSIAVAVQAAIGNLANNVLADMAQSRIKGRAEGAGTGPPTDLTPTEVVSIIDGEAPTWTALHTFTANILLESTNPRILIQETGLAADTGMWDVNFDAGSLAVRTRTDADGTGVPLMTATRPSGTQPLRLFIGALDADLAGFSTAAGNILNYGVVFSAFDLTRNANFVTVSSQRPLFNLLKYQTSLTSPTQIVNNTALHAFQFSCYNTDNAAIATTADITCTSTENWSGTAQGTRMDLRSTPNGTTTRTTALRLAESQCQLLAGSATAPSLASQTDTDTGAYWAGANNWAISTGGTLRWDIDTARIVTTLPQRGPDGTAGSPTYSWANDTDCGLYRIGANQWGMSANSVLQLEIGDSYSDHKTQTRFTGEYRPAQYTADQDDIALPATASVFYFSTDASRNLTGLQGGVAGRMVFIINNGTQPGVLVNDATSTAANRFLLASGTNTTLQAGGCAILLYDGAASRWRQMTRGA